MYKVKEDELELKPADKYVLTEYWRNIPDKYLRMESAVAGFYEKTGTLPPLSDSVGGSTSGQSCLCTSGSNAAVPRFEIMPEMKIRKTDPGNKNISYFETRKIRVPQITPTYAQATKPSTTQTDPNITTIIRPPLQYRKRVTSANPMPSTSSTMPTVSTSSSTQAQFLPSAPSIKPTIQIKSQLT
ncbi:hypothetical protein TNCV_483631 [Trichonephila clavipes]|uniref:Uncharacterized protein n=2 Tax=Trichonephila clavipes TaxID=2585209 RepID=A0A8X6R6X5_TRICX|nr:hypothetical protein TNCV_483631 [Trichonephila clavipes]